MSKGLYASVGGTARKIKKAYVPVGGIAHKVKKVYFGVGGTARCVMGGGELSYYGTIEASGPAAYRTSSHLEDYALIGGGYIYSSASGWIFECNIDAYSVDLTRNNSARFNRARASCAGANVGGKAIFAGGKYLYNSTVVNNATVEAVDNSLTMSSATSLYKVVSDNAGTQTSDYAMFAGGTISSSNNEYDSNFYAFDSSLTQTRKTLSSSRTNIAATSIGNNALFGGGSSYSNSSWVYYSTIDCFSNSLVRSKPNSLSEVKQGLVAASNGEYALFAGGANSSGYTCSVDAFDSSITKIACQNLPRSILRGASECLGEYALLGFGISNNPNYPNIVYVYDSSLTLTEKSGSGSRYGLAASSIGEYALFGGGMSGSTYLESVDVFTIA